LFPLAVLDDYLSNRHSPLPVLLVEQEKMLKVYPTSHQIIIQLDVVNNIVIEKGKLGFGGVDLRLELTNLTFFLALVEHEHSTAQGLLSNTMLFGSSRERGCNLVALRT